MPRRADRSEHIDYWREDVDRSLDVSEAQEGCSQRLADRRVFRLKIKPRDQHLRSDLVHRQRVAYQEVAQTDEPGIRPRRVGRSDLILG